MRRRLQVLRGGGGRSGVMREVTGVNMFVLVVHGQAVQIGGGEFRETIEAMRFLDVGMIVDSGRLQ